MLHTRRSARSVSSKHPSILDADYIVPDSDVRRVPTVDNGLALCKIHHAAFDQKML
ncbi:HNH endonuclease [Occultella kanbiaonis]|uniref:HNH endonuclease n=1 Tax=Occultella kanbiaonis TaxID=2675754 RepID=UPI0039A768EB